MKFISSLLLLTAGLFIGGSAQAASNDSKTAPATPAGYSADVHAVFAPGRGKDSAKGEDRVQDFCSRSPEDIKQ